jgi:hypothetical protein
MLANPDNGQLQEVREQLQQALSLAQNHPFRRKKAQQMMAELSYREGRAGLSRAENELRTALNRFQEAKRLDNGRDDDDLTDWIEHLENILRMITPSPSSASSPLSSPSWPSPTKERPVPLPLTPAPKDPSSDATVPPSIPPASLPASPLDGGVPSSGGGILL